MVSCRGIWYFHARQVLNLVEYCDTEHHGLGFISESMQSITIMQHRRTQEFVDFFDQVEHTLDSGGEEDKDSFPTEDTVAENVKIDPSPTGI